MEKHSKTDAWRQQDPAQWAEQQKQKALLLLKHSEDLCRQLFFSGDLTGYLTLLARLHSYDYRNLLLIYEQIPTATCLGSFTAWQALLKVSSTMVLNKNGVGQGLDLLAPFTEHQNGRRYLTWYSVRQYDVSQIRITYDPSRPSQYLFDTQHQAYLADALRAVLGYSFQKSMYLVPKSDPVLPVYLPYLVTEEGVTIRKSDTLLQRIRIMTEVMGRLSAKQSALPASYHGLFAQCFCFCLFSIWGCPEHNPAPGPGMQISSVPQNVQPMFLDTLQQAVRQIEETTACAYYLARQTDQSELPAEDITDLLGLLDS